MNLTNILAIIGTMDTIENVVQLDWLGQIIRGLIEGCNSIGLGIIVFTLILKLITLPFDIFSRISTKKSSVMMEKIRPELEKLQRQYANNKELYQKKMADLYKKNGYSPFSACLPTILNLVFFIVVIGQFSTYSNYANFGIFCKMSDAYTEAVENYDNPFIRDENGELVDNPQKTEYIISMEETVMVPKLDENGNALKDASGNDILIPKVDEEGNEVKETKKYLNIPYFIASDFGKDFRDFGFEIINNDKYNSTAKFGHEDEPYMQKKLEAIYNEASLGEKGAFKGVYSAGAEGDILQSEGVYKFTPKFFGRFDTPEKLAEAKDNMATDMLEKYSASFVQDEIKKVGRVAAAEVFRADKHSFLWVKNIWSQDLPWQHPVKQNFSEYSFVKSSGCCAGCNGDNIIDSVSNSQYQELTGELEKEKKEPNGYLILVILSIGTMLLSQLVMSKQNKTQMELSSVDGENGTAAMSQKMMTWMMPIMFGVFSFMYTASFSIYIVMSSVFSLLSTVLINKLVEKRFEKKAEIEAEKEVLKRTGRINQIEEVKKGKHGKNKKVSKEKTEKKSENKKKGK